MNYKLDYDTAIRETADTLVERLPSTPDGWGFLALAVIGIWFACMVAMILGDALLEYCAHKRAEHEMSSRAVD